MRLGWNLDGRTDALKPTWPAGSNGGGMSRMLNWTATTGVTDSFTALDSELISISSTIDIHLRSCVYDTARDTIVRTSSFIFS